MDKDKIQSAIQEMQAVYDDPKTPLDMKESIGAALTRAKDQYAEYERDPHGQKRLIEDCHEILVAIKEYVNALNVSFNKGLHTLHARQIAEHGIITNSNIRPKFDDQKFEDDFIIFDFKTQHFNESPAAVAFFNRIILMPDALMYKSLILAIAKDIDNLLGIQEKAKKDGITPVEFGQATGYVVRASFFLNPLISGITNPTDNINDYYPIFLSESLVTIAERIILVNLKENETLSKRGQKAKTNVDLKATEKAIQDAGGDMLPESVNWVTFDLNGRRYEIVQKVSGYQLNMLSYFDDFFERKIGESEDPASLIQMAVEERKEDGGQIPRHRHPGLTYAGMDDPQVNSLSDFELDGINSTLSNDQDSTDEEIIEYFVEELYMDRDHAKYLVTTYRPRFLSEPLFELDKDYYVGDIELSDPAQETYDRLMALYNKGKTPSKKEKVRKQIIADQYKNGGKRENAAFEGFRKFVDDTKTDKKANGGKAGGHMKSSDLSPQAQEAYDRFMALYKEGKTPEAKTKIRNQILVEPFPNKRGDAAGFEGYRKFMEDTRSSHAKGGKTGFLHKVKAVEKKLEGKRVPKKYQNKATGKRYTKKTAITAAKKIIGAQERNEKKKGPKKMLLGGIALHTPPAISLMGNQDNLSIHGAG